VVAGVDQSVQGADVGAGLSAQVLLVAALALLSTISVAVVVYSLATEKKTP